jgi:UDP-glucose 4-epimerase
LTNKKTIIVTGAAGYIGGQIALQLTDAGHDVVGVDRRPLPDHLNNVMNFVQADFDSDVARQLIIDTKSTAIIHCAGTNLVGPSITHPSEYYDNNIIKTIHLLDFVLHAVPDVRFIFSSSAATYGMPIMTPCQEVDPCEPISPYGESKLMIERVLSAYHRAYKLDYVSFRYFNACGADSKQRHGQESGATHIIAKVLESVKNNTQFTCNGNNYETPDGTCIRDYVHVEDIATAHIMALDSTLVSAGVYNLGTANGSSNIEIVAEAQEVTGKEISVAIGPAREGDPAVLTADAGKFNQITGWQSTYSLNDMVKHAWAWYNKQ